MSRSGLFWGAILIAAGVLLLLDNLDILPPSVNVWGLFWPALLIGLGLWTLWGVFRPRPEADVEHLNLPLDGASRARVRLEHGAGRLEVRAGTEPGTAAAGSFAGGVQSHTERAGDEAMIKLSAPANAFPRMLGQRGTLDWSVSLTNEIPIALEVQAGANDARLDLSDLVVTDFRLETGASATQVILPARAGHTHARIEAGAASVTVRVPEQAALRLRIEGALTGTSVDTRRFPRTGEVYQSPGYDTAGSRTDLTIEAGAGSIRVQ